MISFEPVINKILCQLFLSICSETWQYHHFIYGSLRHMFEAPTVGSVLLSWYRV